MKQTWWICVNQSHGFITLDYKATKVQSWSQFWVYFYDVVYLPNDINVRFYKYLKIVSVAISSAVVDCSQPYTDLPVDGKEHDV